MLTEFFERIALRAGPAPSSKDSEIVQNLRTAGFHVLPSFLPTELCRQIVDQFDEMLALYRDHVQHEKSEGTSGDYRLFGVESKLDTVRELFADEPRLRRIAGAYMRRRMAVHFVMANKVVHSVGMASNSGAGWHRDSGRRQFKAIVYLTDVSPENGPFTILAGSRDLVFSPRTGARNKNRFDDGTVADYAERHPGCIHEITGPAGTCILVDTSNVHRGKDIAAGSRYALTSYYYEDSRRRRMKTQDKWGQYLLGDVVSRG